jgi:hypothetical protein
MPEKYPTKRIEHGSFMREANIFKDSMTFSLPEPASNTGMGLRVIWRGDICGLQGLDGGIFLGRERSRIAARKYAGLVRIDLRSLAIADTPGNSSMCTGEVLSHAASSETH